MGRLTSKLVQSAYRRNAGRNEFGDTTWQLSTTAIPCLYRDISIMQDVANREEVNLDGQLWFDADASVAKGDVFLVGTDYLRIERVIIARSRLRDNEIEFIKCEVTKTRQIS